VANSAEPTPAAPTTSEDPEQARQAWRVLSVTSVAVLLAGLNTSTLDVALPAVARHFSASATQASWIVLSYMLVNTVLLLVFGRVADIVGRRRFYKIGLTILTVASLAAGYAPSAEWLAVFRAVQAIGSAAILTNTTALLTDVFPPRLLSRALGINVSGSAASQVAGPLVGGALVGAFGWRAVFLFNVPVGIFGLIWAHYRLGPDRPRAEREPFDVLGAVLAFGSIGGIVLALAEGAAVGWATPEAVTGFVLAAISIPALIITQSRRAHPLIDLSMFAERERLVAFICAFLMAVARFAAVLLMSLYLQAASGEDPFQAGLRVIPVAAGLSLASPVAGMLATRYSARWLSAGGMLIICAGMCGMAISIAPDMNVTVLIVCLLAVGVGTGIFMTPNTSSIMANVSPERRGIANGIRSMLQNTGFVFSTALALAIVTSGLVPAAKKAAYAGTLSHLSAAALSTFTSSYRLAFLVLAAIAAAGAVASLFRSGRTSKLVLTRAGQ
jgi:EmrB/QacA subfamily drug resistance transporter